MSVTPETEDPLRTLEQLTGRLERVLGAPVITPRQQVANVSSSSINLSAGNLWGVAFAVFGLIALIFSTAAVMVSREQVAQLRHEVEAVRAATEIATANDAQHARRLSTIEGEVKVLTAQK